MNQKNSLGLNKCFLDKIDPIDLFEVWMNEAKKTELNDPNAVALGTSDKNNSPSIRMVLLKDFNKDGFVFYTNFNSQKGHDLRTWCMLKTIWCILKGQHAKGQQRYPQKVIFLLAYLKKKSNNNKLLLPARYALFKPEC